MTHRSEPVDVGPMQMLRLRATVEARHLQKSDPNTANHLREGAEWLRLAISAHPMREDAILLDADEWVAVARAAKALSDYFSRSDARATAELRAMGLVEEPEAQRA